MTRRTHHPRRPARVPAFVPVPLRARADGWTPLRQAKFLVALARTRSVAAAAREAGMARETAYRLRRRPGAESFAAAWDRVLGGASGPKRKVTPEELFVRAFRGLVRPVVHRGECVALARKADNTALLRYLALRDRSRFGRYGAGGGAPGLLGRFVSISPACTQPADHPFPRIAPAPIGPAYP